jgi:hypothetical protein
MSNKPWNICNALFHRSVDPDRDLLTHDKLVVRVISVFENKPKTYIKLQTPKLEVRK